MQNVFMDVVQKKQARGTCRFLNTDLIVNMIFSIVDVMGGTSLGGVK